MEYKQLTIKAESYEGILSCYEHTDYAEMPEKSRPAILILPGGGYVACSDRECEVVALEFFNRGYNAYALKYPCAPARYPIQIIVAAAVMDTIRKRAPQSKTDVKRVFAAGFSAGGHLCGCLANCPREFKSVKKYNFKPNGIVLGYPVIREHPGHEDSYNNLLGDRRDKGTAWLDLHTSVTKDNPPAFMWATADDSVVPVISTLSYAEAYNNLGLKYELHIFSSGPHGMSLADKRVSQNNAAYADSKVAKWVDMADEFLRGL